MDQPAPVDGAPSAEPEVLKVSEVAKLLRIGQRQAREAMIRGEIPCHRLSGQWRCSKVAIHRWLEGSSAEPSVERGAQALISPTPQRRARRSRRGRNSAIRAAANPELLAALARLTPEQRRRLSRAGAEAIVAAIEELARDGRKRLTNQAAADAGEPGKGDPE
jgi:excisionase family DNA binding protein